MVSPARRCKRKNTELIFHASTSAGGFQQFKARLLQAFNPILESDSRFAFAGADT
jgi:hypothetical protein